MENQLISNDDLLPILIWIGALGKALVNRGVITKSDLTDRFEAMKLGETLPLDLKLALNNMIKTVETW
jgi:hypothetical protein